MNSDEPAARECYVAFEWPSATSCFRKKTAQRTSSSLWNATPLPAVRAAGRPSTGLCACPGRGPAGQATAKIWCPLPVALKPRV